MVSAGIRSVSGRDISRTSMHLILISSHCYIPSPCLKTVRLCF